MGGQSLGEEGRGGEGVSFLMKNIHMLLLQKQLSSHPCLPPWAGGSTVLKMR